MKEGKKKSKKVKTTKTVAATSQSLAVKYRPKVPSDLVGQSSATTVLNGIVKGGKVPGGILITGPYGTGKTTIARIIASHLNMDKKLKFDSPSFIEGEKHRDVTVLNAGTDGRIENIRSLIRGASMAPSCNFRVIIIDEAHKLTGASADALLLPLEEPSPRTLFILCTSESDKISKAISSRCCPIQLRSLQVTDILSRLAFICDAEGSKLHKTKDGKKALKLIAQMSDGSVRDAIAHLELLLLAAHAGEEFDAEGALTAFVKSSTVDLDSVAASLVLAIMRMDVKGAVHIIRKTEDPRGTLYKTRALVDYLIGKKTKTAKFMPYSGRVFEKLINSGDYGDVKLSFNGLIMLLQMLINTETQFNSVNVSELILLQANIGNFILEASEG